MPIYRTRYTCILHSLCSIGAYWVTWPKTDVFIITNQCATAHCIQHAKSVFDLKRSLFVSMIHLNSLRTRIYLVIVCLVGFYCLYYCCWILYKVHVNPFKLEIRSFGVLLGRGSVLFLHFWSYQRWIGPSNIKIDRNSFKIPSNFSFSEL